MKERVLITGGAGFIGSHVADELLAHGYRVRVLDCLQEQVHGPSSGAPVYLSRDVEFVEGDIRDAKVLDRALKGVDVVYHLAAAVGVGQSMYEIESYTSINNLGTAVLLEKLINAKRRIRRLVVASSMSIYGEGLYEDADGRRSVVNERPMNRLREGLWDLEDADGRPLKPVPTPETKQAQPSSVYALGKYDQERMCLLVGGAYQIPTVALRFFNVFGTRQSLSNPYTGVLAIFATRLLNNKPPLIFEDGLQQRDFVSVKDIAQACRLAMEAEGASGKVFNVGSGRVLNIRQVADRIAAALNKEDVGVKITGKFRTGDIRNCFADITQARAVLGYKPQVTLEDGLVELACWLETQIAHDRVDAASAELARRGLAI